MMLHYLLDFDRSSSSMRGLIDGLQDLVVVSIKNDAFKKSVVH